MAAIQPLIFAFRYALRDRGTIPERDGFDAIMRRLAGPSEPSTV